MSGTGSMIRCEGVGVAFTRGSRRAMLRKSLRRAFAATRRGAAGEDRFFDDPSTFWALRDVDFATGAGSIVGICGANGAGKTTLLRTISGIYRPDRGRLQVNGRTSVLLSLTAMLSPNLPGRVNVRMAGALHGVPGRDADRHERSVQEFAELDDAAMDTPVRFYSAGMRARLAFASASVLEPEILLVDELLGVGDASFRKKSSDRLLELTASARCVLVTSHNATFLRSICHRVLWLDAGRVVRDGPADEVLAAYSATTAAAPTSAAGAASTPPRPQAASAEPMAPR